jgi:hypothetical protein
MRLSEFILQNMALFYGQSRSCHLAVYGSTGQGTSQAQPIRLLYPIVYRGIGEILSFVYFCVGWHASSVILLLGDIIFAQLALPLKDVIYFFTMGIAREY